MLVVGGQIRLTYGEDISMGHVADWAITIVFACWRFLCHVFSLERRGCLGLVNVMVA